MNIGIIVHSQTGNTHSVAMRLVDALRAAGHTAGVERVEPDGDAHPGARDVRLKTSPEAGHFDALVFGAPVQAFSLSAAMAAYLNGLRPLDGKKAAFFVTKALPFRWTGGNRAVGQMRKICELKGAAAVASEIIFWKKNGGREESIRQAIENIVKAFPV
jgi:flavodoxin